MAATVDWPEFFKELDELMDKIEKKERLNQSLKHLATQKQQKEKEKKEQEKQDPREANKEAHIAFKGRVRSEEELWKELADTFAPPIVYLKNLYLKKGFSWEEAFTLALETYKIYINFALKEALK